jgi:hypothetical protein
LRVRGVWGQGPSMYVASDVRGGGPCFLQTTWEPWACPVGAWSAGDAKKRPAGRPNAPHHNVDLNSDFKLPASQVQHWLQGRIQGPPTQVTSCPANSGQVHAGYTGYSAGYILVTNCLVSGSGSLKSLEGLFTLVLSVYETARFCMRNGWN